MILKRTCLIFISLLACDLKLSSSSNQLQVYDDEEHAEERAAEKVTKLKRLQALSNDKFTESGMKLVDEGGKAIGKIAAIDYTQSPNQIAYEIADAVVPLIAAGLALIPGFGPLLSGLFAGLWGLLGPLIAPQKENPLEKIINMIQEVRKETDEKLKNIINRAIHGEIVRNAYICNKYKTVSSQYLEELMHPELGKDKFRQELLANFTSTRAMIYVEGCDNFLKDTAEAFIYAEYAKTLWFPSVITALARTSFLGEISNYWKMLGMPLGLRDIYKRELTNSTKFQFGFCASAMRQIFDESIDEDYDVAKDRGYVMLDHTLEYNSNAVEYTPYAMEQAGQMVKDYHAKKIRATPFIKVLLKHLPDGYPFDMGGTMVFITYDGYSGRKQLLQKVAGILEKMKSNGTVTDTDKAACKMQSQLLYFDRELYPYGNPKNVTDVDMNGLVDLKKIYNASDEKPQHFQIFFKMFASDYRGGNFNFRSFRSDLNCIMGPMRIGAPPVHIFKVNFITGKSYEVRLLYFSADFCMMDVAPNPVAVELFPTMEIVNADATRLNINFAAKSPSEDEREDYPRSLYRSNVTMHRYKCPFASRFGKTEYYEKEYYLENSQSELCWKYPGLFVGHFNVYYLQTINVKPPNDQPAIVDITDKTNRVGTVNQFFLLGVEFIVLPAM